MPCYYVSIPLAKHGIKQNMSFTLNIYKEGVRGREREKEASNSSYMPEEQRMNETNYGEYKKCCLTESQGRG